MEEKISFLVIKDGRCLTSFDTEEEAKNYARKSGGYVDKQIIDVR